MARTVDQTAPPADPRHRLGWFERDYTKSVRIRTARAGCGRSRVAARIERGWPSSPLGSTSVLIRRQRRRRSHSSSWPSTPTCGTLRTPENFAHKNALLNEWSHVGATPPIDRKRCSEGEVDGYEAYSRRRDAPDLGPTCRSTSSRWSAAAARQRLSPPEASPKRGRTTPRDTVICPRGVSVFRVLGAGGRRRGRAPAKFQGRGRGPRLRACLRPWGGRRQALRRSCQNPASILLSEAHGNRSA